MSSAISFNQSLKPNRQGAHIYIALGGNLAPYGGAVRRTFEGALKRLDQQGVHVRAASRPWRTPAWPDASQPPFLNAAAQVESALEIDSLMAALLETEAAFGRRRAARNAPRPLDLDLIDWRSRIGTSPGGVILPHPRAHERAFVLLPLREIAPSWRHPIRAAGIDALIAALPLADRLAARPDGPALKP